MRVNAHEAAVRKMIDEIVAHAKHILADKNITVETMADTEHLYDIRIALNGSRANHSDAPQTIAFSYAKV